MQSSLSPEYNSSGHRCGLAGGLLTAVFTPGIADQRIAIWILTDVKLLELSNADLPVLGQLALRAPGTNQHSHAVVSWLKTLAAQSVGIPLARIGALYHDIGSWLRRITLLRINRVTIHMIGASATERKDYNSHVTYGSRLARKLVCPRRLPTSFLSTTAREPSITSYAKRSTSKANEKVDEATFAILDQSRSSKKRPS
jgi:putative nucleotidyltransferase with HDIG domain